jgi:cyclopropane-fatty-acyl-phospholipid synthase
MNAVTTPIRPDPARPASIVDTRHFPTSARMALRLLERLQHGVLTVTFPDGQRAEYGPGGGPRADIELRDWRCFTAALQSGDIGFAETWIDGGWNTSDLAALLGLFTVNRSAVERALYGKAWVRWLYRLRHLLNRNNRSGSRRNIHAHYDIGNDFYRLWLDPGMTYSSALFAGAENDSNDDLTTLAQSQQAKLQRALDMLKLTRVEATTRASILEIGCGWGGLAEIALRAGIDVTGLTLSTEQLAWAQDRCNALGASAKADLRLQDYRDCNGRFDGIVSIEMFEAVGEAYWPDYFRTVQRNLKPGGRACIQTIVIDDALFERYRKSTDFIQQYIFPGGMLPSREAFRQQAEHAGLRIVDTLAFGGDYARTLNAWRRRFEAELPAIRGLGLDEAFIRTWTFYLCYCEAAFRHGNTDVIQFTLEHAE